MPDDLTDLLRRWPFDPEQIAVREVETADGRLVLQVRLDLGILQMELEGRPDGRRFDEYGTCLEAFQDATAAPAPDDLASLRSEIAQFHSRAQALMLVGRHAQAARDGDHMVQAARLLRQYEDEHAIPLLRSAVTLRARAAASAAMEAERQDLARLALEGGLGDLAQITPEDDRPYTIEWTLLTGMMELLTPRLPGSQRTELESRLRDAVAQENYELAAILRNELRMLD